MQTSHIETPRRPAIVIALHWLTLAALLLGALILLPALSYFFFPAASKQEGNWLADRIDFPESNADVGAPRVKVVS